MQKKTVSILVAVTVFSFLMISQANQAISGKYPILNLFLSEEDFSPNITALPLVGCMKPNKILIVVVFPAPLVPMNPNISPL